MRAEPDAPPREDAAPPAAEPEQPENARADEAEEAEPVSPATPVVRRLGRVTAVLVARDGASYLPRTLAAVAAQTTPPDRIVGVDAGSGDGGAALIRDRGGETLRVPRRTEFGDAVRAAVTAIDSGTLVQDGEPRPDAAPGGGPPADGLPEWLWLLHDDSAPEPGALRALLETVDAGPSIGVAGCKQVSWDDRTRLIDVGFTTSRFGARVTGIDVGDVDQGQLDHRSDVLAVSTPAMLVRRDVWDALGGPDPALGQARDDLDLCRRAHQAGHRVVVVPRAVVAVGAGGRTDPNPDGSWLRRERRAAVHLRLAASPWPLLPLVLLWTVIATAGRVLVALALKRPERASAEASALGLTLLRPMSWLRARRRDARTRTIPRRAYRRLLAGDRQAARQRRDAVSAYLREQEEAWAALPAPRAAGAPPVPPVPPVPPDAVDVGAVDAAEPDEVAVPAEPGGPAGRRPLGAAAAVAALTGVAALAGLRPLLGGTGQAAGPALVPAPDGADALWHAATSPWRAVALGADAVADPLLTGLAALATVLGGSTRAAVDLVLIGGLPLAALAAWCAAGAVTGSRALRSWAALAWAAAPPLLLGVAAGRLGAILAHVLLPLAAVAVARSVRAGRGTRPPRAAAPGRRPRGSVAAASAAGLLLTAVLAAAPMLAVPCAAGLAAVALLARTRRGVLAWTAAVPAVLLLPWWAAVARAPRLLLAEPGGPTAGAAERNGSVWNVVGLPLDPAGLAQGAAGPFGRLLEHLPGAAALTPDEVGLLLRCLAVAVAAPALLVAVLALLRRDRRPVAAALLWALALAGLAVAGLAPRLATAPGDGGDPAGAWPGPGLSLLLLGVLGAALCRLDGAAGRLRSRSLGPRHLLAVGTAVALVAAPVAVLATWAVAGATARDGDGWVRRAGPDVVPAVAAAEAEGPAATRTLVLRVTPGGVRWYLARAGGPRLGDTSAALADAERARPAADPAAERLLGALGGLLSDAGKDERAALADLGIGSVLLLPPADDGATAALDTAPGLVRVAQPGGSVLWRVELAPGPAPTSPSRPARVRVLARDGTPLRALPSQGPDVRTEVEAGDAGRLLVLAERADDGWRAELGGSPLAATTYGGWAQAFHLPMDGGALTVHHAGPADGAVGAARLAVLGLALLVAVPLPRGRRRWRPPPAARLRRGPGGVADVTALEPRPRALVELPDPDGWADADPWDQPQRREPVAPRRGRRADRVPAGAERAPAERAPAERAPAERAPADRVPAERVPAGPDRAEPGAGDDGGDA